MNRAERRKRSINVHKRRVKMLKPIWGEFAERTHLLKSTSTPCSCICCRGERFNRKLKHKSKDIEQEIIEYENRHSDFVEKN